MDVSKKTQEEIDNSRELENMKRVEAALFISGKFLSTHELVALTDLNPILLSQTLSKLEDKYGESSAITIVNKADLWKMDVSKDYYDIVNKLATGNEEFSKAEQETLAMIAHKQPITQSRIVNIRGNKSYDHIKKFVDLGLITAKPSGRTKELTLSESFYDYFNIKEGEKAFKSGGNSSSPEEN